MGSDMGGALKPAVPIGSGNRKEGATCTLNALLRVLLGVQRSLKRLRLSQPSYPITRRVWLSSAGVLPDVPGRLDRLSHSTLPKFYGKTVEVDSVIEGILDTSYLIFTIIRMPVSEA
jgi:hypothetical protein